MKILIDLPICKQQAPAITAWIDDWRLSLSLLLLCIFLGSFLDLLLQLRQLYEQ